MNLKKAIALALITDRDGLISLLQRNGIIISKSYSDHEIIIAILEAVRSSDRFKKDLADYLATVAVEHQASFTGEGMFGFTGENMFRLDGVHPPRGWYGADGRSPAPAAWGPQFDGSDAEIASITSSGYSTTSTTSTPTTTAPSTSSKLFDTATVKNILNSGLNVLSTTLTNKSNKDLANTALEIEQEKTKQAALLAASGGAVAAKKGMSTGAVIGLVVLGLGVVGLTVWAVSKHRKARRIAKAS